MYPALFFSISPSDTQPLAFPFDDLNTTAGWQTIATFSLRFQENGMRFFKD
jgi:hypothetical protein